MEAEVLTVRHYYIIMCLLWLILADLNTGWFKGVAWLMALIYGVGTVMKLF